MRKCPSAVLALVLATAVAGCGGGTRSTGVGSGEAGSSKPYAELRWGSTPFPGVINYNNNLWSQVSSIESLAVQNLVEFDASGKTRPGLASSIEHPNPTTYIYDIKSGVRFSDGKPLTLADVIFSLRRNVTGKESEVKSFWEDVSSIVPHGRSAVMITLKRPNAVWPDIMGATSQIIEKAQAEKAGEKALGTAGHLPMGTGPWRLDSFKPEVSVQLSRNPYWTGPRQPAAKITVDLFKEESALALAMRSGAIDGTFNYLSPRLFANMPHARQLTAPGGNLQMLQIKTTLPPFNDVHVRRAIAYATDVKGMIAALYPGTAAEDVTIAPDTLFAGLGPEDQVHKMLASLPRYDYDVVAAKRELAKSAYPHGFAMKVQALAVDPIEVQTAQIVASDLNKVGITATVQEIPLDESTNFYGKKVTVAVNEYYALYPDPEGLMGSLLPPSQIRPPGSGLNVAEYRNAEVDRLLPEELEAVDPASRLRLIGRMLSIVGDDVPYRPLFTHDTLGSLSDKFVFPSFSTWTVDYGEWAMDVKRAS